MTHHGGFRHPATPESFEYQDFGNGIVRAPYHTMISGMNVFSFAISRPPKSVERFMADYNIDRNTDIDYLIIMKDLKIGIVTWFNYANPGTAFQAYALQQYVNGISHCKAEIVNVNHSLTMIHAPILRIYAKKYGLFSFPVSVCLGIKAYKFCSFQRKYIIKYPSKLLRRNLSYEDCRLINDRYDWVILGSDQLWNIGKSFSNRHKLFLDFVSGPKKGAYAPSIGKEDWPENCKDRIKELLSDFSFIGVREKQAVNIVQPLAKVPVHWSLDPIFLLNKTEWSNIAKSLKQNEDYIFEYCIIKSPKLRAATEKLAAETGLPIIEHHGDIRKHIPSAKRMPHPSADTWLGYLMNTKYVVTDSFHGCAFSVNTNVDFFAVVTSNGSRISSMLGLFGLESRVLTDPDEIDPTKTIDWDAVNLKLEDRRKESQDWLYSSLMESD